MNNITVSSLTMPYEFIPINDNATFKDPVVHLVIMILIHDGTVGVPINVSYTDCHLYDMWRNTFRATFI